MNNTQKLAVIAYNNTTIVDRTFSKIVKGIESLKELISSYRNVRPIFINDTPAVPATANIVSLIGASVVDLNNDKVFILSFNSAQTDYYSNKAQVDVVGFMVKETYSDFNTLSDHSVVYAAGSSDAAGSIIPQFTRNLLVSPKGGVNSVSEYFIANVNTIQNAPSSGNTTQSGLTYPTFGDLTEGQEGLVLPIPLSMNNANQPGATKWQALVFKNANLSGINITVTPVLANAALDKVIGKMLV